eukprot:1187833-Prorocentrum_minimum.AAC.1
MRNEQRVWIVPSSGSSIANISKRQRPPSSAIALNIHTIALNIRTIALNIHTIALNIHTIALNIHTIALNIHNIAQVYASNRVPDIISEANLLESGNDNNIVVTVLKIINLFGIRDKAKLRTRGSKDMPKEEVWTAWHCCP